MSNTKTVMGQASNQYVTPLDITDVFSTYLYTGTGAAQTITNGIDLDGEGGLVWIKGRNAISNHALVDTERGGANSIASDTTAAQRTDGAYGLTFNSNGFDSTGGNLNVNGREQASWTFRKAPKFFDCVTYSGTGVIRTVNHSLGSVPGMVIVKRTDTTGSWRVYHRGSNATAPENYYLTLNATDQAGTGGGVVWNDTAPTDSVFTVGANNSVNASGGTFVAYVFAHNDGDGGFGPDGSDIIKCGSYTGNDGTQDINLGFEPQWILVKSSSNARDWKIIDNMRGFAAAPNNKWLTPNSSNSEENINASASTIEPTATGFRLTTGDAETNAAGWSYIYMAIRRGPLAQPESGTEVFAVDTGTGASDLPKYISNFPVDMAIITSIDAVEDRYNSSRLTGARYLQTNTTAAESGTNANFSLDYNDGWFEAGGTNRVSWMWKRAPGYFDSVSWKVDGTGDQTIKHNLGVVPEMVWSKNRNTTSGTYNWWVVAHKDLTGWDSANENDRHVLRLNTAAASAQQGYHRDFTATSIRMLSVASGGYTTTDSVIAYLFATLPGVSKVGSYTGTGATLNIDCGFTSGARFVLIKRTDAAGQWLTFDSTRGIVNGNDPVLFLNSDSAEDGNYDIIDPHSSGFTVTSDATYEQNISGGSYIFYAIA